jgi:stress response protein YsnF
MRTIIAAYHDRDHANTAALDVRRAREPASLDIIDHATSDTRLVDSLTDYQVPRARADLYAEAVRRGSALVVVEAEDDAADDVATILDRHQPLDVDRAEVRWRSEGWTGYNAAAPALTDEARRSEREILQRESVDVIEEQVRIGKREVSDRGGVRVRTFISERPVREDVRLREERVAVSREAANEPVPPGATDSTFTEQEYVVTTTSEEPVVQKEARVVERVNIEKEAQTRTETIEETERRRDVEVEPIERERPGPRH